MILQQGKDIRVFNIHSTHEGRGEIIIMMTQTITKAMMLVMFIMITMMKDHYGDDGKCNANKSDNDVENNDDNMIKLIPRII